MHLPQSPFGQRQGPSAVPASKGAARGEIHPRKGGRKAFCSWRCWRPQGETALGASAPRLPHLRVCLCPGVTVTARTLHGLRTVVRGSDGEHVGLSFIRAIPEPSWLEDPRCDSEGTERIPESQPLGWHEGKCSLHAPRPAQHQNTRPARP